MVRKHIKPQFRYEALRGKVMMSTPVEARSGNPVEEYWKLLKMFCGDHGSHAS